MDCPSCGRANAPDRVECSHCDALLVDVFAPPPDEKTDPIVALGREPSATKNGGTDSGDGFTKFSAEAQYSGDLPRLFRFGNRYQVLEKLGEGGMGRVYKALDLELDRPVALKTIRFEKGMRPDVLKRFKQELVLARKITHKNVVRIYDLGEAEGGVKFFTMELIEGKSLRDLLKERNTIPAKEAVSYLKQMLSGLSEAHAQGVIHRDLKPHNVMIDGEGVLRIMDFGIARTADTATLTGSSEMMGTPDYISPEQVKGETTTAQSDLYSLGVILYELLTGDVPFKGDTAISRVVARIQLKPTPPRTLHPEIPPYLERIVLKLMEVDTDLRYKTSEEVLQDLEREQVGSSFFLRTRKAIGRRKGWIAAALVGSVGLGTWLLLRSPQGEVQADVPVTTIAILPFHNMTGNAELEWMENGIQEMLITDISQSSALRPVLRERVDRIQQEMGQVGQSRFDQQTLQLISRAAGADYALHGSFVESKGRLRMDLILRQSTTGVGTPIKIEHPSSEVFALVDELTRRVSRELNLDSWGETDRPLTELSTQSLPAMRAYYQARAELQRGANQAAIPLLGTAIAQDPRFAMAHARLAETYFHLGDEANARVSITTAKALAEKALLPVMERYQIHAIAARIQDDPETAVASYRELAKLFPGDPDILNGLASSLETRGEAGESAEVYRRVLQIAPGHRAALLGLGRMLVVSGHPDEAIPLLREAATTDEPQRDDEALGMIYSILGMAYRDMAQYESSAVEFEQSLTHRRRTGVKRAIATSLNNLASVLRRAGRNEEARLHLVEALDIARETGDRVMESLALANLGNLESDSGRMEAALTYYRKSLDIEWEREEHTELAIRLDMIAELLASQGQYGDALVYLRLSRNYLESSDDLLEKTTNLKIRGRIEAARGNYDEAQAALLEMLPLCQQVGAKPNAVEGHLLLARIYADQGRFGEALEAVGAAELLIDAQNHLTTQPAISRADVLLAVGDAERAAVELDRVDQEALRANIAERYRYLLLRAAVARLSGAKPLLPKELQSVLVTERPDLAELRLRTSIELGRQHVMEGAVKQAIAILVGAREDASDRRLRPTQAAATLALAEAYFHSKMTDEARRYASEAVELAERFDGRQVAAQAIFLLSRITDATGESVETVELEQRARNLGNEIRSQTPLELRLALASLYPWASGE